MSEYRAGAGLSRERRRELYQELLRAGADPEALHALIDRTKGEILDRSVPYALVAVRNQLRSGWRSDERRRRREEAQPADGGYPDPDAIDPAERALANDGLQRALRAMARLDERDSWSLWWNASGYSDAEIAELWDDAGFEPRAPSPNYLRTRRARARQRLRAVLLAEEQ